MNISRDTVARALRTFIITTLALFVPGLLGWLHDVTSWAQGNGTKPFPDGHGLIYLGVSACVAGVVAVVNLIWNAVEDGIGKGLLRTPPSPKLERKRSQSGQVGLFGIVLLAVLVLVVLIFLDVHG